MDQLFKIADRFAVGKPRKVSRLAGGIVNDTYLVVAGKGKFVLQKLHRIFKPELLHDTETITTYLHGCGLTTPRLVRTEDGELHVREDGYWRMLTYVSGRCFQSGITVRQAASAAELVGRFHALLSGLDHRFAFRIPFFHDTPVKMAALEKTLNEFTRSDKYPVLAPLAEKVLAAWEKSWNGLDGLPERIIHGDPKISNVRFDRAGARAVSLLDLDTVGRHKVAVELGDAARTWCNPADEGDTRSTRFDLRVFRGMLAGYVRGTDGFVSKDELRSVPAGIETILLEISARFITDAFREEYFRLEPSRYPDLFEQNKSKATAQLRLFDDFRTKKSRVINIVNDICSA